jgi:S1-C subfamily serine protease
MRPAPRARTLGALGLAAALGGCAAPGEYGPIAHPLAGSERLAVNSASASANFERRRYDPGSDAERAYGAVPKIAVSYADGSASGSGIAFCQVGRRVYLLTARHVATGRRTNAEPRPYRGVSYRLSFYRNEVPELAGSERELAVREIGELDLALLVADLPSAATRVPPLRIGRARALRPGDPVTTLGYSMDELAEWVAVEGSVRAVGTFLDYRPPLSQGFSGGPVFDAEGRVVGLNVEVQGGAFARALPMEVVMPAVRALVDPACPRLP